MCSLQCCEGFVLLVLTACLCSPRPGLWLHILPDCGLRLKTEAWVAGSGTSDGLEMLSHLSHAQFYDPVSVRTLCSFFIKSAPFLGALLLAQPSIQASVPD